MGYAKRYKTNGARLGVAFDAGPMASGGVRLPHGTLRAVVCPDCEAEVGMYCRSNTGKRLNQVHISRRRIAMRKYNEERANADAT